MRVEEAEVLASKLNFRHEEGTVIAVVQHFETKEVLMVGNMNKEAFIKTLTTGLLHFCPYLGREYGSRVSPVEIFKR